MAESTQDRGVLPMASEQGFEEGIESSIAVGYSLASITHPDYSEKSASGVAVEVGLGYRFAKEWLLGLQAWGTETPVARLKTGKYGSPDSKDKLPEATGTGQIRSYATCSGCTDEPSGGIVFAHSMRTLLVGPRLEFAPESLVGTYFGLGGGLGSISVVETEVAGGVTARAGYRYGFSDAAMIGAGLGFTSILTEDSPAWLSHAALELTLR